jgi:hypothetical protein
MTFYPPARGFGSVNEGYACETTNLHHLGHQKNVKIDGLGLI